MYNLSQAKRILFRAGQLGLLAAVFVVGGFLLPMYAAPSLYSALPGVSQPGADTHQISLRVSNRNVNYGDRLEVSVSNPQSTARISALQYACEFSDVSIRYVTADGKKKLPCDTTVKIPKTAVHTLEVFSDNNRVSYVPITATIKNQNSNRDISFVIGASLKNTADKSRLSDNSTVTIKEAFN